MTTSDQPVEANAFIPQRSRKSALFDESMERRFTEAHRVMDEQIRYLTYDEYASGKPCPACERPLLDEPQPGGLLRTQTDVDADNADFRSTHKDCFGFWRIQECSTEHCHLCCPFPPISASDREKLREILLSEGPAPIATWHLKMTCDHIEMLTTRGNAPTTTNCSKCGDIRGVIAIAQSKSPPRTQSDHTTARTQLPYQPLTDERWKLIQPILGIDERTRRGRPKMDPRKAIDAILYREYTGIPWRDLPRLFGSWQSAARWHRQLKASGTWEEVLQLQARTSPS
ncbi:transposase [Brevibacterium aurantiacum]|uniref:Insertion element IS402-like domain-containing protein n=1 Tax=Brevibacterium aurantiacum TaxID=273384 RepID=A0A2A3ZCI8_BREAU|nr:hypothetical protein CIK62_14345 [Brevibacterium aurantiacum]